MIIPIPSDAAYEVHEIRQVDGVRWAVMRGTFLKGIYQDKSTAFFMRDKLNDEIQNAH